MRILVTNDDGIESEGIKTLADALSEKGHIVTVVAPDGNRSAFSHSLSTAYPTNTKRTLSAERPPIALNSRVIIFRKSLSIWFVRVLTSAIISEATRVILAPFPRDLRVIFSV